MTERLPEIWTPRIGQRVRVKLSPECDCRFRLGNIVEGGLSPFELFHPKESDGRTGVIAPIPEGMRPTHESHPFLVMFEEPFPLPPHSRAIVYWCFAPAELLPVFALGDRVRIRDAARYCAHRHVGEPGQLGRIVNRYDSDSGHVWTVELDELRIGGWTRPSIDEFQDEEMEPA